MAIDFGESHYIGPLHPSKTDVYAGGPTGAIKWVTGSVNSLPLLISAVNLDTSMTHDAWRDIAAVYIAAYKAGASAPTVNVSPVPLPLDEVH
jgi:glucan endo-1,3-alpha-glucosidase